MGGFCEVSFTDERVAEFTELKLRIDQVTEKIGSVRTYRQLPSILAAFVIMMIKHVVLECD